MIIVTETLVINTDHLLWLRREKEDRWIMVFKGTGVSTTNITEAEAQALGVQLRKVQMDEFIRNFPAGTGTPNAIVAPPPVKPPPKKPPEKP